MSTDPSSWSPGFIDLRPDRRWLDFDAPTFSPARPPTTLLSSDPLSEIAEDVGSRNISPAISSVDAVVLAVKQYFRLSTPVENLVLSAGEYLPGEFGPTALAVLRAVDKYVQSTVSVPQPSSVRVFPHNWKWYGKAAEVAIKELSLSPRSGPAGEQNATFWEDLDVDGALAVAKNAIADQTDIFVLSDKDFSGRRSLNNWGMLPSNFIVQALQKEWDNLTFGERRKRRCPIVVVFDDPISFPSPRLLETKDVKVVRIRTYLKRVSDRFGCELIESHDPHLIAEIRANMRRSLEAQPNYVLRRIARRLLGLHDTNEWRKFTESRFRENHQTIYRSRLGSFLATSDRAPHNIILDLTASLGHVVPPSDLGGLSRLERLIAEQAKVSVSGLVDDSLLQLPLNMLLPPQQFKEGIDRLSRYLCDVLIPMATSGSEAVKQLMRTSKSSRARGEEVSVSYQATKLSLAEIVDRTQPVILSAAARPVSGRWTLRPDADALDYARASMRDFGGPKPMDSISNGQRYELSDIDRRPLEVILCKEMLAMFDGSLSRQLDFSTGVFAGPDETFVGLFSALHKPNLQERPPDCLIVGADVESVEATARSAGYHPKTIANTGGNVVERVLDALDEQNPPGFVYLRSPLQIGETPLSMADITRIGDRCDQLDATLIIDTSLKSFLVEGPTLIDKLVPQRSNRILLHAVGVEKEPPQEGDRHYDPLTLDAVLMHFGDEMLVDRVKGRCPQLTRDAAQHLFLALRGARLFGTAYEVERVYNAQRSLAGSPSAAETTLESALRTTARGLLGVDFSTRSSKPTQAVHVVGGGPAGLMAAVLLQMDGYQVYLHDDSLVVDEKGERHVVNAGIAAAGQIIHLWEGVNADSPGARRQAKWVAQTTNVLGRLAAESFNWGVYPMTYVEWTDPQDQLWTPLTKKHMRGEEVDTRGGSVTLAEPSGREQSYHSGIVYGPTFAVDVAKFLLTLRDRFQALGGICVAGRVTPEEVELGLHVENGQRVPPVVGRPKQSTVVAVGQNARQFMGLHGDPANSLTLGHSVWWKYDGPPLNVTICGGPYILQSFPGRIGVGGTSRRPVNLQRYPDGNIMPPDPPDNAITDLFADVGRELASHPLGPFQGLPDPSSIFTRNNLLETRSGYRMEGPEGPRVFWDKARGLHHVAHIAELDHTGYSVMVGAAMEARGIVREMTQSLGYVTSPTLAA